MHGLPNGTRPKPIGLVAFAWALIATGELPARPFPRDRSVWRTRWLISQPGGGTQLL